MSTYDNLPVYKESYDLLVSLFTFTKDFLGVSIRKGHMYPRHRLKGNMYRAIMQWNALAERGGLDESQVQALRSSLNSYLGNIGAYRTRGLRRKMLGRISPVLLECVAIARDYRKVTPLTRDE